MQLRIRNRPNFYAGLMFAAVGGGFSCLSSQYQLGTAGQMGPGYFPFVLGGALGLLGLFIAFRSLTTFDEEEAMASISFRPLFLVLSSLTLFAALLLPLGLVLASVVLVIVSALASDEFHWKYTVLTAIVLIAGSYLIFVFGLGLPMPVWPGGR